MLQEITPQLQEEINALLLKLVRRSVPLEHFLKLEEVVHNTRCKTEGEYIYFSFRNSEGDIAMSFRGRQPEKNSVSMGFLFTVLNSHLMEFAAAFSGKPVKLLPVRPPDLAKPPDRKHHDELSGIAAQFQFCRRKFEQAASDTEKVPHAAELARLEKSVNRETVRFYGLTKREIKLLKAVMEY
ncbi:MAG: hypothetical protein PHW69_09515 [Elusimicrobiaceae bacterium]|nr:hypothetical protein [Elusimicrobiaceae bacterium]